MSSVAPILQSQLDHIEISISDLESCITSALLNLGYSPCDADIVKECLMYAELRGNNQGIIKLISGALHPSAGVDRTEEKLPVIYETKLSAKIDGCQRVGMVAVSQCVDTAIAKAKEHGMSVVGCSNYSSATGALGFWAKKIAREGLIGIVMSQCNELVAPHTSYEPIFGTNPIAIGLPTSSPPFVVLDMATSAIAMFGVVKAKEEGTTLPEGVALDCLGHETTDPAAALNGAIRVFDRGFKGSHLALIVELLAGAWTGAAMRDKQSSGNWGSVVLVIDPAALGPLEEFQANAAIMCERVKNAKKLHDNEIYLPGERGDRQEEENLAKGTLKIPQKIYQKLMAMSGKDS